MSKRLGRCYELAGRELLERCCSHTRLVHGMIARNGFVVHHAWLEWEEEWFRGSGTVCWEPVTDLTLPQDAFERLFGAEKQVEYTRDEASKLMLRTKHYGPWEERSEQER